MIQRTVGFAYKPARVFRRARNARFRAKLRPRPYPGRSRAAADAEDARGGMYAPKFRARIV